MTRRDSERTSLLHFSPNWDPRSTWEWTLDGAAETVTALPFEVERLLGEPTDVILWTLCTDPLDTRVRKDEE